MFIVPTSGPWLAEWNRVMLDVLFRIWPHNLFRVSIAETLTLNPLLSTWMYAAAFYLFWRLDDERTVWRRSRLLEIVLAFALGILISAALRPWIAWPAPARVPAFQSLYPGYLWNNGTANCFPSHATLVYFLVAAGLWRLGRWPSLALAALALLLISFPRIYLGGHYPIDIFASIILASVSLWVVRCVCARPVFSNLLTRVVSTGLLTEFFLFLWLFELGEGFHASSRIFGSLFRAGHHVAR